MNEAPKTFTGRRRERKTRRGVKIADAVSRSLITMGGVGTIIAVSTVCVFLVYVAAPLFTKASMEAAQRYPVPWQESAEQPIHISMDEYQLMGWAMFADGTIQVFRCDTGQMLGTRRPLFEGRTLTAWSFNTDDDDVCFGFNDGQVKLGRITIEISFLGENQVAEEVKTTPVGRISEHEEALYVHPQPEQFRRHRFNVTLQEPVQLADGPIDLIGHTIRGSGPVIVVLSGQSLAVNAVTEVRNFLTGAVTPRVRQVNVPYTPPADKPAPAYLLISGLADTSYLVWRDGFMQRYDTRDLDTPQLAETLDLVPEKDRHLTALRFLIGRTTLISGDSAGQITAWFRIANDSRPDMTMLAETHDLGMAGAAVTALSGSARSRLLAAGFADGRVRLFHVTTHQLVTETPVPQTDGDAPIQAIALGARDDSILAAAPGRLLGWAVDRRYPAVNLNALFAPVWYEGYSEPRHMWQSSAGTDDFEPKYGLVPLIFGTLKATFYSMLFGLPIALLAAIYTSEFLHPKLKARLKPLIEMMASLPSVVLGFLAALVVAPAVEDCVPTVLAAFLTIPLAFLVGAYIWQIVPRRTTLRLERYRFWFIVLMAPLGVWLGAAAGPQIERWFFSGDIKRWLDGQIGTGVGGWFFLLLPLSAVIIALIFSFQIKDRLRQWAQNWTHGTAAWFDAGKFLIGLAGCIGLALAGAWLLTTLGLDPRGEQMHHFAGTYVQRNAMIVGFIMGFAIIPIIYTLAEDALSSVPDHLRSASLGAGATPWQTATRVIVPTAMSGLFSAAMIGLGRAVGETMIVLMAAGNTPVMQMNIFNGFRTLSANIAVELPEAPVGGTHYRVLFLAALALFVMTFVVNTVAEIVRLRFRKRAFQL